MPVVDGEFVPRSPLVPAELHVDYLGHNTHIEDRRQAVERHSIGVAKRIGYATATLGVTPAALLTELEERLAASLNRTAAYGYTATRRELRSLRAGTPRAHVIDDAGDHAHAAADGLPGVRNHIRRRAREAAHAVVQAASAEALKPGDKTLAAVEATKAATRILHNAVLDLVGETLNMGRIAGALSVKTPPEFALRSEQLDAACCEVCVRLHGSIAIVGSDEFYRLSPPAECLGGGRCRGIWVFGDQSAEMELADAA